MSSAGNAMFSAPVFAAQRSPFLMRSPGGKDAISSVSFSLLLC